MHRLNLFLIGGLALLLTACEQYYNVPPNDIGMKLTPTGYDGKIYTPGQVDLGVVDTDGMGNSLVLIQRSGFQIKEAFSFRDGEDHRCLVGPSKEPMMLDVRLVLALPDYATASGKKDLERLFHLGNPQPLQGSSGRVLRLTAQSVYVDQARLQVRGKIRQICAQYQSFDAVFISFGDESENGLSRRIERAVGVALKENQVPLHLVNAVVSNMKPDQTVTDAIAAKQAATKRVEAIRVITDFLGQDSSGARALVYKMQVLQEIVAKGDEKGRSTVFMTDISGGPGIVPLPQPNKQ